MADLSPTDRLVRKRNSNLQKQLDVTLQILSEEYRQTKERMYKEERDCGKFLKSLYNTVPGLHTYGQPDTRAMNANALLKERRYSMSVSILSGSDGEDLHNPLNPPFKPSAPAPTSTVDHRPKSSKPDDRRMKSVTPEASGNRTESAEGSSRQTLSERNSVAKRLAENNKFLSRPGTTASARTAHNPVLDGHSERPSTARCSQHSTRYGRNAYSEHDRFVQERVLKRFDVIFDPETEARKVNLSTMATPIVMVQAEDEDSNNAGTVGRLTTSSRIPHPHINMIKVNGEEFHLSKNPPGHKRVIWSARPHRKERAESAPNSARTERPTPEIPATPRPASSGLKSPSLTGRSARGRSHTAPTPAHPSHHPGKLDSHVLLLSLQKSLPSKSSSQEKLSESSSESDIDEETENTVKLNQKMPVERKAQVKAPEHSKKQEDIQQRGQKEQTNIRSYSAAQRSRQQEKSQMKCDSSNLLQVPGTHQHPQQQPNGTSSDPDVPPQGLARKNSAMRPSSRLSEASDKTPPVELWSKLMKAGLSGRTSKRPKTAPTKSELSHRSMPAPRQTVVGILAQIENQKANTRNMINASKELQKVVKKLVPWEQSSVHDLDDW